MQPIGRVEEVCINGKGHMTKKTRLLLLYMVITTTKVLKKRSVSKKLVCQIEGYAIVIVCINHDIGLDSLTFTMFMTS